MLYEAKQHGKIEGVHTIWYIGIGIITDAERYILQHTYLSPLKDPNHMLCLIFDRTYSAVSLQQGQLSQKSHSGDPIAHSSLPDMGSILWLQTLIYVLHYSQRCCLQYSVLLGRAIKEPGPRLNIKTIPIIMISHDRLIFIMGIPILVKTAFYANQNIGDT